VVDAGSVLINLGSGVFGALLGAFAAYRLQIRESRKLSKGAARAVYLELFGNLTTLQGAKPGGFLGSFTADTWRVEQARLASYLPVDVLMKIAYAYSTFPNAETALATLKRASPGEFHSELATVRWVAQGFYEAAVPLNALVWSDEERARLGKLALDVKENDAG
jgi:hypothetical protein